MMLSTPSTGGASRPSTAPLGKMPVAPPKNRTPSTTRRPRRTTSKRVPRQMDTNPVAYWNEQAKDYDENIFSTIDEDATRVITRTLDKYANKEDSVRGRCVDLGCGAGKYLPALASRFRHVVGYDLSPKLVQLARKEATARGVSNVEVGVRDLAKVWFVGNKATPRTSISESVGDISEMESYGFAVMANVLIAPVPERTRTLMLENAFRALCPGGKLLAVVPSMESALYVNMRCAETNCASVYDVIISPTQAQGADLVKGIVPRSGVRTKHYLEAEFRFQAELLGFTVESLAKVEYTWRSELGLESDLIVPTRLRQTPGPLPWDWLFVLRKPGRRGSRQEEGEDEAANMEVERSGQSAYANPSSADRTSSPSSGEASTAAASSSKSSSSYDSPLSSLSPSKPLVSQGSTPTLPPVQPSTRLKQQASNINVQSPSASRSSPSPTQPSPSSSPIPSAASAAAMMMATSTSMSATSGFRRAPREEGKRSAPSPPLPRSSSRT